MHQRSVTLIVLALILLAGNSTSSGSSLYTADDSSAPQNINLQDFDLLSPNEGWIILDQHLYWTTADGLSWNDITPSLLDNQVIAEVAFLDSKHGWLVLTDVDDTGFPTYTLARTVNGGSTWEIVSLDLFQPGDPAAFAGDVYLHFLDTQTGWLVVERATSSNFSVGTLFYTDNGGTTWTERTIPIGDSVVFTTPEIGWTAGGTTGDELYRTTDGGRTWQPQSVGAARFYRLPSFTDAQTGVLPAVAATESGTRVERYETNDGGETWYLATSQSMDRLVDPIALPLSTVGTDRSLWAAPGNEKLFCLSSAGRSTAIVTHEAPSITKLAMVTSNAGWALSTPGHCEPSTNDDASPDPMRLCSFETSLLATSDGGRTWYPLDLPGETAVRGVGDQTQIIQGHGFDKCEVATLPQLANWISNSPYESVNLYIGGSSRACANSALSASYVSQMGDQGWTFIPTWVGPQAPCSGYSSRFSYDTTTAYNQGIAEADAAVAVAVDLGLTLSDDSGTIIYYDLENYNTGDTACREAAKAFMSGWTERIRALGNQAGVYSNGPPLSTFAAIDDVPDAIWPAHWIYSSYNANATVWDVYSLSNSLWANHQRIRQYAGGHNESWGGVTLNIDSNVIDGIVAALGVDTTPPSAPSITISGPGCAAVQSGTWQNTCHDPMFSWTATDTGSGVKDYGYYWGTMTGSEPDTWTTDTAFDPDPIASVDSHARYILNVVARDNVDLVSPWSTFDLLYDRTVPTVTSVINGNASTTNQVTVRLDLSAGDTGSGVDQVRLSNNGIAWSDWQSYASTLPWTLPALDRRELTVYVQVRDAAGNVSTTASDKITLDLHPPMPHSADYRLCASVMDAGGLTNLISSDYSLVSAIGQPWGLGADTNSSMAFDGYSGFLSDIDGCLPITRPITNDYAIVQWVIGSGGGLRSSTSFRLGNTTGQHTASGTNSFSSGGYILATGFWAQTRRVINQSLYLPLVIYR